MSNQKILVVEDEPKVAAMLKQGLEEKHFQVDLAYDGYIGARMATTLTYDLIILDINLPHKNGFAISEEVRNANLNVPILMLTALGTTEDKLTGFDAGADDYLVKPFEIREVVARVRALLKRNQEGGRVKIKQGVLKVGDLELDEDSKIVRRAGKEILLTGKEYYLLEYLMRNKGKVLSRGDIAEKVWDFTFETGTNVIDVYINFLRKKIDKDFPQKLIHTRVGMGYILTDQAAE